MLKAGDRAPDFSNPDADMNIVELSQFRGKTLVLYFYVRDDTPGCTTEAIEFSELEDAFPNWVPPYSVFRATIASSMASFATSTASA